MKKIFLPLLALCGMITGFTLTSCGGGGGGGNLTGTTIYATGNGFSYYITFTEKTGEAYQGVLSDYDGNLQSRVTIMIDRFDMDGGTIRDLAGSLASASFEADDAEAMYRLFVGETEDGEGNVVQVAFANSPTFEYQPVEGKCGNLVWSDTDIKNVGLDEDEDGEADGEMDPVPVPDPAHTTHSIYDITRG